MLPIPTPIRHQRLTEPDKMLVHHMVEGNIFPQQILTTLRKNSANTLATPRTIYNFQASIRKENLDGLTPMERFLQIFKSSNWQVAHHLDPVTNKAISIFFAHPESIKMARGYHHVALIDTTYRTNKFNLPLLHCVSLTASNQNFSCGFCLLPDETDDSYLWAILQFRSIWNPHQTPKVIVTDKERALQNALEKVFPDAHHNLCAWHISKNITTYCRKYFPSQDDEGQEWEQFQE